MSIPGDSRAAAALLRTLMRLRDLAVPPARPIAAEPVTLEPHQPPADPTAADPNPDPHSFRQTASAGRTSAPQEPGWRTVIDAIIDPAIAVDADDVIVHFNPTSADFFPAVRISAPLGQISRSPDLQAAVDRVRKGEDRIVADLQERVPVERRLSAFVSRLTAAGETTGTPELLIVFRDVTDQEKLAQMRADFIANASHELRTPLATLKGFVETLQGPARNDEAARERFLAMMATQATRMSRLIDDLLLLSRAEMSVHLPPRDTVELCQVLDTVVETLQPLADTSGITLNFRPAAEFETVQVRGEREELVQAFLNLVQNAIKYGRSGGHVDVRIGRASAVDKWRGRIRVSVIDDGPGIAPEHLPRLSERFYRVNVGQSREKGGTGLGLAIVKYIVSRHRGELTIRSEVGKGSVFSIELEEQSSAA